MFKVTNQENRPTQIGSFFRALNTLVPPEKTKQKKQKQQKKNLRDIRKICETSPSQEKKQKRSTFINQEPKLFFIGSQAICFISTHFKPMFHFYTPWYHQKSRRFLFSRRGGGKGDTNRTLPWNRLAWFLFTHRLQQIHFVLQLPSLVKCSGMHGSVKPIKIFLRLFTPFRNQILKGSRCSSNEAFLETFTED